MSLSRGRSRRASFDFVGDWAVDWYFRSFAYNLRSFLTHRFRYFATYTHVFDCFSMFCGLRCSYMPSISPLYSHNLHTYVAESFSYARLGQF